MDKELAALKEACDKYQAAAKSDAVGALDWSALLLILPAVLSLFVKDQALRDVITRIVELLRGLFAAKEAE